MRQVGLLRCASPIVKSLLLPMPSEMRARDRVQSTSVCCVPRPRGRRSSASVYPPMHILHSGCCCCDNSSMDEEGAAAATVPPLHRDRRALPALLRKSEPLFCIKCVLYSRSLQDQHDGHTYIPGYDIVASHPAAARGRASPVCGAGKKFKFLSLPASLQ
jgi:hypothetical protein